MDPPAAWKEVSVRGIGRLAFELGRMDPISTFDETVVRVVLQSPTSQEGLIVMSGVVSWSSPDVDAGSGGKHLLSHVVVQPSMSVSLLLERRVCPS